MGVPAPVRAPLPLRFAPSPLRLAPAPVQARPAPQPIQVFEVTPNNINFGEFPRNQFIQRQPVIPFAPVQHSVPVGHHFIPATIAQSRQPAPTVAPTAAPIAAPTAAPALVE